jgi:exoribonuclease R
MKTAWHRHRVLRRPGRHVSDGKVYRALVRNRAQLAYNGVGAWLEGSGPAPAKVAASADLAAQLKLQDTPRSAWSAAASSTARSILKPSKPSPSCRPISRRYREP